MAARSLLFQLPRFIVSSRLGALYRHASPSTGLQRKLSAAASQKQVAAAVHGEGGAIVATSLPWEADVAAGLLAVKRRATSHKPQPLGKPRENPGKDNHNGVPDKKAKEEGEQGIRNNYAASS